MNHRDEVIEFLINTGKYDEDELLQLNYDELEELVFECSKD